MTTTAGDPRAEAATIAALLDQARIVDRLSRPLTVAALIALLALAVAGGRWTSVAPALLLALAAVGLVEAYLTLRVRFDAGLFAHLADGDALPDLATLDRALLGLGLMPAAKAGRPLAARIEGARRLFRLQGVALALQIALILAGALLAALDGRA